MKQIHRRIGMAGCAVLALSGIYVSAQESDDQELAVDHANCSLFGAKREELTRSGLEASARDIYRFSRQAIEVASRLAPEADKGGESRAAESANVIDQQLSQAWRDAGVTPARRTTDSEFLRRVTLDLTGRIPTAEEAQRFAADSSPDKRTRVVDALLASSAWVDKWTLYFGDMFKNTLRTTQVVRYADGRDAFHTWIRESLAANKPYDRIATELLTASGTNSYQQGHLNWVVGGFVTGGPVQDIWDQMAVNVAETFLGVGHMNCIMCHDGRRHLDTLSLWGRSATRYQAYQLSAFFSRTELARTRVEAAQATPYYWSVQDGTRFRGPYALNTTTGNRPPRRAVGTVTAVQPEYPFSQKAPATGESFRVALARELTADFQFSRAAVNYLWKEFFTRAFVEPANQFDLARLDPDNPPPDPWKLQPNQPRLLNALAQSFIDGKYDVKALMRTFVLSEAYQLSSRYDGEWSPAWENLYARHLPRRLWAEEIHDAVVQSSNVPANYTVRGVVYDRAVKFPDVVNMPGGGINSWLDSFYRGNRDSEDRRAEGSILQALNLMNDAFVMNRTRATGTVETGSLLRRALTQGSEEQLVTMLYWNVLCRAPSTQERDAAAAALRSGNRQQRAEDLLWSLYNKVDFVFNY